MNRMAIRLEGHMGKYAVGRSITVRGGRTIGLFPWLQFMLRTNYWCVFVLAHSLRSLNYECRLKALTIDITHSFYLKTETQSASKRLVFLCAFFAQSIDLLSGRVMEWPCLYVLMNYFTELSAIWLKP
jgi:hypothetical protein